MEFETLPTSAMLQIDSSKVVIRTLEEKIGISSIWLKNFTYEKGMHHISYIVSVV